MVGKDCANFKEKNTFRQEILGAIAFEPEIYSYAIPIF